MFYTYIGYENYISSICFAVELVLNSVSSEKINEAVYILIF